MLRFFYGYIPLSMSNFKKEMHFLQPTDMNGTNPKNSLHIVYKLFTFGFSSTVFTGISVNPFERKKKHLYTCIKYLRKSVINITFEFRPERRPPIATCGFDTCDSAAGGYFSRYRALLRQSVSQNGK